MSVHVVAILLFSVKQCIPSHDYATIYLCNLFLMDIHYFNSAAANILIINNFGKCA